MALVAARRLFAAGNKGVDRGRGVAINALWDDLSVRDAGARLWPQTERLKTALIMRPSPEDGMDRDAEAIAALNGLTAYFDTPLVGAWRDKMRPDGGFIDEPAPASSFYHIVCAITALRQAIADDAD